jgi:hypothetical protein
MKCTLKEEKGRGYKNDFNLKKELILDFDAADLGF